MQLSNSNGYDSSQKSSNNIQGPAMQDDSTKVEKTMDNLWPQVRKFLVFQIKLYIDAIRDVLLSFLALGAFLIDLLQRNTGTGSYFERVLKFGRGTERAINLFNQFDPEAHDAKSVDGVLNDLEERTRK